MPTMLKQNIVSTLQIVIHCDFVLCVVIPHSTHSKKQYKKRWAGFLPENTSFFSLIFLKSTFKSVYDSRCFTTNPWLYSTVKMTEASLQGKTQRQGEINKPSFHLVDYNGHWIIFLKPASPIFRREPISQCQNILCFQHHSSLLPVPFFTLKSGSCWRAGCE